MSSTIASTLLVHLQALESSILEESKKSDRLIPLVREIHVSLEEKKYGAALQLIDELEEFMDDEFC